MDLPDFIDTLRADLRAETHAAVEEALLACLPGVLRRARLPPYLDTRQLCDLTGWSVRKVAYLRKERRVPFIRRGRSVLYRTADVEAYLDEALVKARVDEAEGEDAGALGGP